MQGSLLSGQSELEALPPHKAIPRHVVLWDAAGGGQRGRKEGLAGPTGAAFTVPEEGQSEDETVSLVAAIHFLYVQGVRDASVQV